MRKQGKWPAGNRETKYSAKVQQTWQQLPFPSAPFQTQEMQLHCPESSFQSCETKEWPLLLLNISTDAHFAFVFQIAFVGSNHDWNVISTSHSIYKLLVGDDFIKAASVGDGVTDDESFSFSHVLLTHGCEFRLKNTRTVLIYFNLV